LNITNDALFAGAGFIAAFAKRSHLYHSSVMAGFCAGRTQTAVIVQHREAEVIMMLAREMDEVMA